MNRKFMKFCYALYLKLYGICLGVIIIRLYLDAVKKLRKEKKIKKNIFYI